MGKAEVKSLFYGCLILATFLLAGVTIAAAFSGSVSPMDSTVMPLLGLAVPVLLIVNLIVALCWAWAHKRWTWIPVIAIFCNWGYLTSVIQFHSSKEKHPDGKYLKTVTFNVGNFGSAYTDYTCKEIARYMEQEGVDVLCFQEFSSSHIPQKTIRRIFSKWPYSQIPTDSTWGKLPIAVFSRYPLINPRFIGYEGTANSSMICDVVMGTDTVRIINNHLQTTSISTRRHKWERAMKSAEDTRREVDVAKDAAGTLHDNFMRRATQTYIIGYYAKTSPYPVVLCGDFNSIPASYTYHYLNKTLKDGFRTAGNGYMFTYRYGKRLFRIDYLFHSPSLKGFSYYSPNIDFGSDHNPVIMEVELP